MRGFAEGDRALSIALRRIRSRTATLLSLRDISP